MPRILVKITDFLVYSNIYVAIPIVCLTLQTGAIFSLEAEPQFLTFIYCATLFSYCFHRTFPFSKKESRSLSERHIWVVNNKLSFTLVKILSFIGCIVSFFFLRNNVFCLLLPAGCLTFFYTVPFLKIGGNWTSLRNLPYLKLFLIALTVSYITVLLPWFYNNPGRELTNSAVLWVSVERFFFLLAITIPFDIRDIKYDKETGLKTIPLLFGAQKSICLSYLCLFLFISISVIHYFFLQEHLLLVLAMIASGVVTAICVSRATPDKSEYYFSLLIEGTMILQFFLVSLAFQWG
ncbi:MAG TPA: hypothetical protein EYM84_08845 [Flavobacteriales bacterium]|nr:hypothetical protein [Flavobacteriales bacterium]